MKPIIQQKAQDVELIAGKLKASQTTVVVDYRGLTVKEATELRKQLREAGVEFKVYKNNLVRRAAQEVGMEGLVECLTGPNAIATCAEDAIAPAKVIYEFAKTCPALEIKGGVMDGVVVTAEEITVLATLPNRDGMLSMLLSVLQAPMRNMALAVKAVAEQKEA